MIGVITTFYGYKGESIVEKVKNLIGVFESISFKPFIQLFSAPENNNFDNIVYQLNQLKERHQTEYSVHQSIWLPSSDFYLNLGSSDLKIKKRNH